MKKVQHTDVRTAYFHPPEVLKWKALLFEFYLVVQKIQHFKKLRLILSIVKINSIVIVIIDHNNSVNLIQISWIS